MSFLNKVYSHDRDENFKEFVDSLGLPEDKKEVLLNFKPSQSLKKDGDQYVLVSSIPGGGNKEIKFDVGVEFEEEISPGVVGNTKFDVDGNVVIQSQKFGDNVSLVYKREYSDDELVVSITTDKWDGIAYRYYKAV